MKIFYFDGETIYEIPQIMFRKYCVGVGVEGDLILLW